jgi:hypothetical protein
MISIDFVKNGYYHRVKGYGGLKSIRALKVDPVWQDIRDLSEFGKLGVYFLHDLEFGVCLYPVGDKYHLDFRVYLPEYNGEKHG